MACTMHTQEEMTLAASSVQWHSIIDLLNAVEELCPRNWLVLAFANSGSRQQSSWQRWRSYICGTCITSCGYSTSYRYQPIRQGHPTIHSAGIDWLRTRALCRRLSTWMR